MGIVRSIIDGVDSVLDEVNKRARTSLRDYCDLETVDENVEGDSPRNVLVSSDGSLITMVEILGYRLLPSDDAIFKTVVTPLTTSLKTQFEQSGYQMQFVFEVDPDRTRGEIKQAQEGSRQTVRRFEMDLEGLLDSREEELSKWVASERCWLVLKTSPRTLVTAERKEAEEQRKKESKGKIFSKNSQDPLRAYAMLRNRHSSFVELCLRELQYTCGMSLKRMSARGALREIKRSIDSESAGPEWEPVIPGDKVWPTERSSSAKGESWEILPLPLADQLVSSDARITSDNTVRIGNRIYSPMYLDVFPRDWVFANALFMRAREKRIPWRISFNIEGNGLSGIGFRLLVAQILTFTGNTTNKLITSAIKDLQIMQEQNVQILKMQCALTTWAPHKDSELLARRASDLARCVESWGAPIVSSVTGNPLSGLMSTIPAFASGSIATPSAPPAEEGLSLLPFGRPCSPWQRGSFLQRTPDGKLMPFEPFSAKQATWISLIFAPPGSGKSVLMNAMNLALSITPGKPRIPRIAILDVGYSSQGLISLIQDALPPSMRHLAVHRTMQMNESDSINPWDTQLCCRFPTSMEKAFLVNFLALIATEVNAKEPDKGMTDLVSAVVEQMFKESSDLGTPARYTKGVSLEIDEVLVKTEYKMDKETTWWEIVDFLFLGNHIKEAKIAQRFAVPLLQDAIAAAQNEKVRRQFEEIRVSGTGEPLIEAFSRMVTSALRTMPILARPTAFDLGNARIVALDLDQVARGGGVVGERTTALMYMLARQVLAKDYYLKDKTVEEMPCASNIRLPPSVPVSEIKAYHLKRVEEIFEDPKRICYDEFHRTKGAQQVRDQVELDMREGRKFNVDIILAGQDLVDFSEIMRKLATSVYIMSPGGNKETLDGISNTFGLTEQEKRVLATAVHTPRPGSGGGTYLTKYTTNEGDFSLLLKTTLCPEEMWAFNTTAKDVVLRKKLTAKLQSSGKARKVLSKYFPSGDARRSIEDREVNLRDASGDVAEKDGANVYEKLADDLISWAVRDKII